MSEKIDKVTNADVLKLLSVACEQDSLLQIMVDYEPPACMTRIHSFDLEDESLMIHPFGVTNLDDLLLNGVNLEVALKVGDKAYRFDSSAVKKPALSGPHRILLPKEMELIKRRMYFRVTPPGYKSVMARIQLKSTDNPIITKVSNLSVGGVLICQQAEAESLEIGAVVLLILKFEMGHSFSFKARVCHVAAASDSGGDSLIGLEFLNQIVSDEISLGYILMQWQDKAMWKQRIRKPRRSPVKMYVSRGELQARRPVFEKKDGEFRALSEIEQVWDTISSSLD